MEKGEATSHSTISVCKDGANSRSIEGLHPTALIKLLLVHNTHTQQLRSLIIPLKFEIQP